MKPIAKPGSVHFIHIPKTGGSSIEQVVGGRERFPLGHRCPPNSSYPEKEGSCVTWHTPIRYLTPNPYRNATTFCVVRDPMDRLISEYKMFNQASKEYSNKHMNDWLEKELIGGMKEGKGRRKEGSSRKKDWKFKANCHFLPQFEYVFLGDNRTRACNVVIAYSNIHEGFKEVGRAFGKNWSLDEHHTIPGRTGGGKERPTIQQIMAKNDQLLLNRSSISPRAKNMIRHIYKDDYELLSEYF